MISSVNYEWIRCSGKISESAHLCIFFPLDNCIFPRFSCVQLAAVTYNWIPKMYQGHSYIWRFNFKQCISIRISWTFSFINFDLNSAKSEICLPVFPPTTSFCSPLGIPVSISRFSIRRQDPNDFSGAESRWPPWTGSLVFPEHVSKMHLCCKNVNDCPLMAM